MMLTKLSILALTLAAMTWPSPGHAREQGPNPGSHEMKVHYPEIVTGDVDSVCAVYSATHGVEFGQPIAEFGGARTASMPDGSLVGVRGPLRETEAPVVRPYWLVDDIEAAIASASASGAEVAIPPMEMPGRGKFAIYILGGIEHGLWQR